MRIDKNVVLIKNDCVLKSVNIYLSPKVLSIQKLKLLFQLIKANLWKPLFFLSLKKL